MRKVVAKRVKKSIIQLFESNLSKERIFFSNELMENQDMTRHSSEIVGLRST